MAVSSSWAASWTLPATLSLIVYLAFEVAPDRVPVGVVAASTWTIRSATRTNSGAPNPREVSAGVPIRTPDVYRTMVLERGWSERQLADWTERAVLDDLFTLGPTVT